VEWERAPDCSSATLSIRIPLLTANLLLGLVVQQFAEGVNSPVVLRLRGGMQIVVKTLTGKTITLEVGSSSSNSFCWPALLNSPR